MPQVTHLHPKLHPRNLVECKVMERKKKTLFHLDFISNKRTRFYLVDKLSKRCTGGLWRVEHDGKRGDSLCHVIDLPDGDIRAKITHFK